MTLEDIGEDYNALLCVTSACCTRAAFGNWFFPNGTRVLSYGEIRDFYRFRGQLMIYLNRRRGGVDGIYHCVIPDSMNVIQNIYIGVYTASTGELYKCTFN